MINNEQVIKLRKKFLISLLSMIGIGLILIMCVILIFIFWQDYDTLFYADIIAFVLGYLLLGVILFIYGVLNRPAHAALKIIKKNTYHTTMVVKFISTDFEKVTTDRLPSITYEAIDDKENPCKVYALFELQNIDSNHIFKLTMCGRYAVEAIRQDEEE